MNGISTLIKETSERSPVLPSMQDTARRRLYMNQEACLHQIPKSASTEKQISALQSPSL